MSKLIKNFISMELCYLLVIVICCVRVHININL